MKDKICVNLMTILPGISGLKLRGSGGQAHSCDRGSWWLLSQVDGGDLGGHRAHQRSWGMGQWWRISSTWMKSTRLVWIWLPGRLPCGPGWSFGVALALRAFGTWPLRFPNMVLFSSRALCGNFLFDSKAINVRGLILTVGGQTSMTWRGLFTVADLAWLLWVWLNFAAEFRWLQ